jgi:glycosyltransferase involved in cell wall biosynthesis
VSPSPGSVPAGRSERAEPRVAVVIPCYNDGEFVVDAVDSALEQEPCEIVVVNDGSDDPQTLSVLERLPEPVQVVNQPNGGLSAARMAGVEASSARYVQPLDADDRLAPGVLTTLADVLDADSRATAAWGLAKSFGAGNSTFPHWPEFDPWRLTFINEIPMPLLIRRGALLAVGGWDLSSSGFEDWDLNLKGAERGWVAISVPEPHNYYREHEQTRMLDQSIRDYEVLRHLLRERHPRLYAERRRTCRRSTSRLTIKLAWTLIEALPFLSEYSKGKLFNLTRDTLEPEMRPSGVPALGQRVKRRISRLLSREPDDSASMRARG